jgi:hypothetical protein
VVDRSNTGEAASSTTKCGPGAANVRLKEQIKFAVETGFLQIVSSKLAGVAYV